MLKYGKFIYNLGTEMCTKLVIAFRKYAVNFNGNKNAVFKRFHRCIEYSRNCYGSH